MLTNVSLDDLHEPDLAQSMVDNIDKIVAWRRSAFVEKLQDDDIDGAREEYETWLDTCQVDGFAAEEAFALISLLLEKLNDQTVERDVALPSADRSICVMPGECYATSTHFSLLTAAIFRQRQQIRELMLLADELLCRCA